MKTLEKYLLSALFLALITCIPYAPSHAHGLHDLLPKLVEGGVEENYAQHVFRHPLLQNTQSPTTPHCKKVRKESKRNPRDFKEKSLERAKNYYLRHKEIFDATESAYGVSAAYILSILRRETYFGICLGDHYILQRLYGIFKWSTNSRKRNFAQEQIIALLSLARKENWDIRYLFSIPSSEDGAFGLGHFIPTSFAYAVDGNDDSVIDLFNPEDAIPSIARYLIEHGWHSNPPQKTLLKYNRDINYVRKIIEFAEKIHHLLKTRNTS